MILYVGRRKALHGDKKVEVWGYRLVTNRGEFISQKIIEGKTCYVCGDEFITATTNQKYVLCMTWAISCLLSRSFSKLIAEKVSMDSGLKIIYSNDVVCKWIEKDTPKRFRVLCGDMLEKVEQLPFEDIKLINSRANSINSYLQYDNIERETFTSVLDTIAELG